ncbi:outer dense fiber protein 2 [Tribolium madens]|uniref:outer dense fiber protein 2 n=1 Tax=Tribolium madens TaxID=41895 RepID=UPI001CF748F2|nr:outer dense fiber protein 2 [Tribolium madens]
MKNRKKILLPNKPIIKRSESHIDKTNSDKPLKKQIFTSVSLHQNLEFFRQQSNLFPKPLPNYGDADTYFRQSLRNYNYFDISFFSKKSNRGVKSARSGENLKKKKSSSSVKPRTPSTELKSPILKLKLPEIKKETDEFDADIFYSPDSQKSSKDSTHTLTNNKSDSSLIEESEDLLKEEGKKSGEITPINMAEDAEDFAEEYEAQAEPQPIMGDETETEGEEEEGEDEMKQVEKMIKQASAELAEVTEENQQLIETFTEEEEGEQEEEGEGAPMKAAGDGSIFKFDPAIDAAVLRELEEAEKQAKATAKIIYELKTRVTELLKKEKNTEAEAKELEDKNKELKAQMLLFEEKTKRIQFLIAQTNLFDKMIPPQTPLQTPHNEDVLPKVIVCGMTEHNIPKLLLCDDKKKSCSPSCDKNVNIPMSVVPKFAKRLSDSYTMQEKLAAENADLEGMRYKLQSDLLNKDQTIEYLQRKLCTIQCEMRVLCKENSELNEKVQQICGQKQEIQKPRRMPCGKGKGPCPADIEHRLNEYSETTKILEKQLCDMESDVKTMQNELTAVQAEREHLEQHKKIIICPPPICHPPCVPPPCPPCSPCIVPCSDLQLRELREQYCRLQDDFKSKVTEVGGLRADNEKLKATAKEAEEARKTLEDRVKELERTLKSFKTDNNKFLGSKEQLIEQEQQLAVAKQRFREAQDELEELRSFIQDQQGQLDDYRNKYLEAQQEVEEQKRHIDMLEMDANRVNEQVNLEIQRVKSQFQEKLQELLPLPDLLKTTQLKLQEAQQMHLLAERNNEALQRDLQLYKDKIAEITGEMDKARSDNKLGENEKQSLAQRIEEMEAKINELEEENFNLKEDMKRTEEMLDETEREKETKMHEIAQLAAQLETVREESARQVARNKERCETVRRSMQNQISDLERQLAQSRAQARAAQKDRDEIRQKMQAQINNLHENFEDAQMRIRNLQGHVNFLKESYTTNVPGHGDTDSVSDHQDPCHCGRDF